MDKERTGPIKRLIEAHMSQQELDLIISPDNMSEPPQDRVNEQADEVVDKYLARKFSEANLKVIEKQKGRPCTCRACAKRAVEDANSLADLYFGREHSINYYYNVVSDPDACRGFRIEGLIEHRGHMRGLASRDRIREMRKRNRDG